MSSNLTSSATVYYVRHGETDWSKSGQHTGRTDIPLTDNGETEARSLAPWLSAISFDCVLTSPSQRAQRTAELAGLVNHKKETDGDLREWDYGAYEGRRTADIRIERPDWELWSDGCPQGESPSDIRIRVDRLLLRLAQLQGTIALVAHGHIGAALAARWCGLSVAYGRVFVLRPASLSILGFEPRTPGSRVVSLWNATPLQLGTGLWIPPAE